jgi:hypothetical protein
VDWHALHHRQKGTLSDFGITDHTPAGQFGELVSLLEFRKPQDSGPKLRTMTSPGRKPGM